jgi:hypothetical protein
MRSLSHFLLFCVNITPYHVQPFPFPSVFRYLPLIMRSFTLYLLFCVISTPYHA